MSPADRPIDRPIDLAAWLRHHREDGDRLTLERPAVRAIQDELQRLRQSNDRMRKQNRKLRREKGDPTDGQT